MRPLSTSRPISGIFSSEALNSELGHPASGTGPLEDAALAPVGAIIIIIILL